MGVHYPITTEKYKRDTFGAWHESKFTAPQQLSTIYKTLFSVRKKKEQEQMKTKNHKRDFLAFLMQYLLLFDDNGDFRLFRFKNKRYFRRSKDTFTVCHRKWTLGRFFCRLFFFDALKTLHELHTLCCCCCYSFLCFVFRCFFNVLLALIYLYALFMTLSQ